MKTQKEWLSELPYPLNALALNRFDSSYFDDYKHLQIDGKKRALECAFNWATTVEGYFFWVYVSAYSEAPKGWIVTPERAYKEEEIISLLKEYNGKLTQNILEQYKRFINIFTNPELKGIIQTNKTDNTMTTPPNTRPFNLQDFLNGKPIVCRNGFVPTDAHYFEKCNRICFTGSYGLLICISPEGKSGGSESNHDLFHPCEQKEGWVNLYKSKDCSVYVKHSEIYVLEEDAKTNGKVHGNYLTTIKITWYE